MKAEQVLLLSLLLLELHLSASHTSPAPAPITQNPAPEPSPSSILVPATSPGPAFSSPEGSGEHDHNHNIDERYKPDEQSPSPSPSKAGGKPVKGPGLSGGAQVGIAFIIILGVASAVGGSYIYVTKRAEQTKIRMKLLREKRYADSRAGPISSDISSIVV